MTINIWDLQNCIFDCGIRFWLMRALRFVAGMRLAQLLADCGARLVLARVLMTDFIDWKIKSL